ncbi:MAG: cobalamin biosynthesis protein CobD [Prolixibacteraceae bacterium]|nr:cobalamin biosynthesis protein CobD [Prolixibacteraceae bacterium]
MSSEYIIYPLVAAFILDSLLGDPRWLPHPIRAFGFAISKTEKWFNSGKNRFLKGMASSILLIAITWAFFFTLEQISKPYPVAFYIISTLFVFYGLANRSLITEAIKVEWRLQKEGLEAAREQLSFIVGRETRQLDKNQIRTAVLETLAENLSDGVVAPIFFYAIGGFPLMLTYKMANTLDSMIGYKNQRYHKYGRFAARFDDFANFVPARITAILMNLATLSWRGFTFIFKYGRKHSSPNAGYPESALAGILNCRFGGPNRYHGKMVEKPYIGLNVREITHSDIIKTTRINSMVCIASIAIVVLLYL